MSSSSTGGLAQVESGTGSERERVPALPEVSSHYWVCTYPFFEATLYVVPPAELVRIGARVVSAMAIYDADGEIVNEAMLQFAPGQVGLVDLDPFLGACKQEGGLRHAHVHVRSPFGSRHFCRLWARDRASLLGETRMLNARKAQFLPLTLAQQRSTFLVLVNYSGQAASVKTRLFCGKRNPETQLHLPALGSRVISIEASFVESLESLGEDRLQAYLRLSVREEANVGIQLIERSVVGEQNELYSCVC